MQKNASESLRLIVGAAVAGRPYSSSRQSQVLRAEKRENAADY